MSAERLEWFGSSGIRGPLARVDPELGVRLGRALATTGRTVVVAQDARHTGPALTEALAAGLLAGGADVVDAGVLPTPALAYVVRTTSAAAGVMVTASHNPAEENGYKVWDEKGSALSAEALVSLETRMRDPPPRAGWDGTGRRREHPGALAAYRDAVLARLAELGHERGSLANLRIALDCAHGAGAGATPWILARLGARLTVLGGTPDGAFPDHPSEPTPENLETLRRILAAGGHDLGIAHDGDADRTVFFDATGRTVSAERLLVVLARRRGDQQIALPVDAGGLVARAIPEARIEITPVGDVHISRAIGEGRATIGAEPSGTWFFADWGPAPEGPYAASLVAAMLSHDPDLIVEAMGLPTPERWTARHHVAAGGDAEVIVARAGLALASRLAPKVITRVDGVRLETADGWLLVRASGTEPIVRVTAEAEARERAVALVKMGEEAVAEAAAEDGGDA